MQKKVIGTAIILAGIGATVYACKKIEKNRDLANNKKEMRQALVGFGLMGLIAVVATKVY